MNLMCFSQENRKRAEEEKSRRLAREKREREAAERRQAEVSLDFFDDAWIPLMTLMCLRWRTEKLMGLY